MTANANQTSNEQVLGQETMFDLQYSEQWPNRVTGLTAKDAGVAAALAPNDVQDWKQRFEAEAIRLGREGAYFTSEDIVKAVGLPRTDVGTNANNAVGAMMNALSRKGVIRKTRIRRLSQRPTSHGAELAVWAGPSSIGET